VFIFTPPIKMFSTTPDFPDRKALIDFVSEQLKIDGYCCSIARSRVDKVWLKCDRGGLNKSVAQERISSSRRIGCPFSIVARLFKSEGRWKIVKVLNEHNHDPSLNLIGHSIARRLKPEEAELVRSMGSSGVSASEIRTALRQQFGNNLTSREDIRNEFKRMRKEDLAGRTPILALYENLVDGPYQFAIDLGTDGSVERLIFCHNRSITLYKRWNSVILMDATYKTNRFRMPLLNIIG
jgi:FAR1 DNA-binding domain